MRIVYTMYVVVRGEFGGGGGGGGGSEGHWNLAPHHNFFRCVCVCASHGEVVPEQLHDESAVLVGILLQLVQLSNGVIESLSRRESHATEETKAGAIINDSALHTIMMSL